MNVMKQDAMDEKIIERCKTCGKKMHARGSQQIEKLSRCYQEKTQKSWWIEDLSRIYQADRELRNFPRWIEEAIENLLRRNLEISMDRESVEIYREKRKKAQ